MTCKISPGIHITYTSTKLCYIIIIPHLLSDSIILLRNLNNYEDNFHAEGEMRTGVGALKSGSIRVRSGVVTWSSLCGVVAELQGVRPLLWGDGGIRGLGLTREKKNPFKKY